MRLQVLTLRGRFVCLIREHSDLSRFLRLILLILLGRMKIYHPFVYLADLFKWPKAAYAIGLHRHHHCHSVAV